MALGKTEVLKFIETCTAKMTERTIHFFQLGQAYPVAK